MIAKTPIHKILIANRGEIALRIMHTALSMGKEVLTLYTQGEEDLPHVRQSPNKVLLGPAGNLLDTYLNIEKILHIAKKEGCDAIHPGYGFLSENAGFAKACEDQGIIFIGPRSKNITLMGDKVNSKKTMEEIQIPLIPGVHSPKDKQIPDEELFQKAKEIKWPVLIKASAGGGGKGMRIVHKEEDFFQELTLARSEAKKAFNNDLVFLEKWLDNPRHIEAQILCDAHGGVYFLGERECSLQRRYQKILEEAPCQFLSHKNRDDLKNMATKIAKHIDYLGLGTLEFLFQDGEFYFLEMNTRIQVEHPVTEMTHGLDLVRLQIQVAQKEALNIPEEHLSCVGHAIEVRICAESPENNYMPCVGDFLHIHVPDLPFNRFDYGYTSNTNLSVYFDPMLAKIICFAQTRQVAIENMIYTLKKSSFLGVQTNKNFLLAILQQKEFQLGNTFTHFLNKHQEELLEFLRNSPSLETYAQMISQGISRKSSSKKSTPVQGSAVQKGKDYWEHIPLFRGTQL